VEGQGAPAVGFPWVLAGCRWVLLGFSVGCRRRRFLKVTGGSPRDRDVWPEAYEIRLRRTVRAAGRSRGRLTRGVFRGGGLGESFFRRAGAGPECGRGSAGQCAAGMSQAFEIVGERLGGEFEVDGFALDGVARSDAQGVVADEFLEALARLVLDDGGFGEQV